MKYNHIAASVFEDINQALIVDNFPITATTRNTDTDNDLSGLPTSKTFTVLSALTLLDYKNQGSFGTYNKLWSPDGGDATTKG